jgi:thiol-disulfide isomerase/thioredoxin
VIKKVEALANLAVIITSLVVCSVLVKRYLLPSTSQAMVAAPVAPGSLPPSSSRKQSIEPGTKISLAGIDWSKGERTLLLALSTTCHFCTESAPFYQRLQQQKRDDIRLLALLPQPLQESRVYLDNLGVRVDDLTQSPLKSVGASGTPTLILIDNQGAVIDSWVGKLSNDAAEKVIALIRR